MTHWWVRYWLGCGCVVRVQATDTSKRALGDEWTCPDHGRQEIVREEGHGI